MSGKVHCLVIIPLPKAVKSVWKCVGVYLIFFLIFIFIFRSTLICRAYGFSHFAPHARWNHAVCLVSGLIWSRKRSSGILHFFVFLLSPQLVWGGGGVKHKKHKYLDIFLPPQDISCCVGGKWANYTLRRHAHSIGCQWSL